MAAIKGFKLIRWNSQGVFFLSREHGEVEYIPRRKYRIEKKNAFNPTIIHQREEYSVNGILICTSFGTLKCTTFHLS